jgi:hypothetical protein
LLTPLLGQKFDSLKAIAKALRIDPFRTKQWPNYPTVAALLDQLIVVDLSSE